MSEMTTPTPTPEPARAEPVGGASSYILAVRPEVAAFALLMERELRANDHKGGWKGDDATNLAHRVCEEADELHEVAASYEVACLSPVPEPFKSRIASEAADVANFCMMVADVCGCLAPLALALAPSPDAGLAEVETRWSPADTYKLDGRPIYTLTFRCVKWTAYKPDGQRQMKAKGRWQEAGEYGGWQNCAPPSGPWIFAGDNPPDALDLATNAPAVLAELAALRADNDRLRADAAGRGEGVSAELRALSERATSGLLTGNGHPHQERGHPDVERFAIQAGKRPIIDGYVINSEDADFIVALWNDLRARLAAAPAPATDGTGGRSDG